jgi:menaquinone-dependent protoporphyrinogen oxidase
MYLVYATRDGQSRRIATRIAERLAEQGLSVVPRDLATAVPSAEDLARAPLVAAVLAVRYGKHLPEGLQFITNYRACAAPPPLALASVNLTARKPGKDTAEGNAYLRKLIERNGLKPARATAFAGRLDYPRYRFFDKQIIRFIMLLTGGPTDPTVTVDYTSWRAVDEFAGRIADLHRAAMSAGPAR